MRVYTEFKWTEKHVFQSARLRTLIQIVRQAFLCRNTRRKDCESRESPDQWRYPVVLPLRNSVVGKGRLRAWLAVLHGVRKEDPFSGTGRNFSALFSSWRRRCFSEKRKTALRKTEEGSRYSGWFEPSGRCYFSKEQSVLREDVGWIPSSFLLRVSG